MFDGEGGAIKFFDQSPRNQTNDALRIVGIGGKDDGRVGVGCQQLVARVRCAFFCLILSRAIDRVKFRRQMFRVRFVLRHQQLVTQLRMVKSPGCIQARSHTETNRCRIHFAQLETRLHHKFFDTHTRGFVEHLQAAPREITVFAAQRHNVRHRA